MFENLPNNLEKRIKDQFYSFNGRLVRWSKNLLYSWQDKKLLQRLWWKIYLSTWETKISLP